MYIFCHFLLHKNPGPTYENVIYMVVYSVAFTYVIFNLSIQFSVFMYYESKYSYSFAYCICWPFNRYRQVFRSAIAINMNNFFLLIWQLFSFLHLIWIEIGLNRTYFFFLSCFSPPKNYIFSLQPVITVFRHSFERIIPSSSHLYICKNVLLGQPHPVFSDSFHWQKGIVWKDTSIINSGTDIHKDKTIASSLPTNL